MQACNTKTLAQQQPWHTLLNTFFALVLSFGLSFVCSWQVWNPCFDVTPATLIEGVITERGLLPNKNGAFDVAAFMRDQVSPA